MTFWSSTDDDLPFAGSKTSHTGKVSVKVPVDCIVLYCVFILSAISPYTTGLEALFNPFDCTVAAPTHK